MAASMATTSSGLTHVLLEPWSSHQQEVIHPHPQQIFQHPSNSSLLGSLVLSISWCTRVSEFDLVSVIFKYFAPEASTVMNTRWFSVEKCYMLRYSIYHVQPRQYASGGLQTVTTRHALQRKKNTSIQWKQSNLLVYQQHVNLSSSSLFMVNTTTTTSVSPQYKISIRVGMKYRDVGVIAPHAQQDKWKRCLKCLQPQEERWWYLR